MTDLEAQQRAAAQRTSQELADLEYRAVLSRSDDRILQASGGRVPLNPLAPKEPLVRGSEAEYEQLLDQSDPRILMRRRKL